jgi:hypothetical protein
MQTVNTTTQWTAGSRRCGRVAARRSHVKKGGPAIHRNFEQKATGPTKHLRIRMAYLSS